MTQPASKRFVMEDSATLAGKLDTATANSTYAAIGGPELAGKAGVRQAKPGNRVVYLGDSITAAANDNANNALGSGWPLYTSILSGQRLLHVRNAGVPGDTSARMLARFDTDVTPYAPSIVPVLAGTNDIGLLVPLATYQANMKAIVAKIRAIGAVPVLATIPCRDVGGFESTIVVWNTWLRRYANSEQLTILDFYRVLANPATGHYAAAYVADGVHPNPAGDKALGALAASVLAPLVPSSGPPLSMDGVDVNNLAKGVFVSDANSDGVPDNWIAYGGASGYAHSLTTTDTLVQGWLARVTQTANANIRILERGGIAVVAGDKIVVSGVYSADGGCSAAVTVKFNGASTGTTARPISTITSAVTRGVFYQELTAPAGTTSVTLDLTTGAGTGWVEFGQVTLYNLTTMGVPTI